MAVRDLDPTPALFRAPEASPFGRQLTRPRGARLPVVLVTGFLGAGKTTLIRHFLESGAGQETAVIVNEIGEIGIDNAILRTVSENVVLLGNGCLCCNLRSDLEETLAELLLQAMLGKCPSFRRVVVETTGLADPGPVLQTFSGDRGIGREFHLETVNTVVDGQTIGGDLERFAEAQQQVVLADRLVVSKTDLVPDGELERIAALLSGRNPAAEICTASEIRADPAALARAPETSRKRVAFSPVHSHGVDCFAIRLEAPVRWEAFRHAFDVLAGLRGQDLLRVKGLLAVPELAGPLVIHAVRHVLHPPVELTAWPDCDRAGRLVFIGRDLSRKQVEDLFAAVAGIAAAGDHSTL